GTDSESHWDSVVKIESDYRRQFDDDPRLPWLAWQLARADLLQAQQGLAKWLATPAADNHREAALQAVRRVLNQLDALEKDIKDRLPLSLAKTTGPATGSAAGPARQAPSRELQELSIDCTLLRCESLLVRARCYPAGSPDRLAASANVERTASDMLARSAQDWSSRDELIVAQATAGLEVGKRLESLGKLTAILRAQPAEPVPDSSTSSTTAASAPTPLARLRAGSVLVETLCDENNSSAAEQILQELSQNFSGPEIELSRMRVALARMNQLSAAERPAALKSIVAQAQSIGQRYGSYWRNRSEALLVAQALSDSATMPSLTSPTTSPGKTGSNVPGPTTDGTGAAPLAELLTIEIKQLLAGGQTSAAIVKLRAASTAANAVQQPEPAILYAVEAAKLLQQEKQWQMAADLLVPLASQHPTANSAPAAHVLAIWCLAQALQTPRTTSTATNTGTSTSVEPEEERSKLAERYEKLLIYQLSHWPDAAETGKAEEYLSNWLAQDKRYDELATMWAQRAESQSSAEKQLDALRNWLDTLLARLPKAQLSAQIERIAKSIAAGKFAKCQRSAIIMAIAANMLTTPLTQTEAESLNGLTLPGYVLEQSRFDQALLSAVFALAATRRGDLTSAINAVGLLNHDELSSILRLAWCKSMVESFDELPASQIGKWVPVVEQVRLPSDAQLRLPTALKMTGLRLEQLRTRDALAQAAVLDKIKQLAGQHASDPLLQLASAAAIAQTQPIGQGADQPLTDAIRIVKRVASGTKKDSEAYLRARWLEIQWRIGQGDSSTAAQVARLTLSSHDIQPAWWKARFESVAKQ
ncbi:MAG: hypothetical protein IT423_22955, partial [Pirellulaceae bacterium]|nr:hypothetical protein [Pirellulaceae bacterium]